MAAQLGKVCLVGAGPGASDLLTVRAASRLAHADVVLVDDLVDPAALDYCAARATIIYVGKRGGCRSTPQPFIQRLMLRYARQGKTVVRLKGGDPYVFGRGAEERDFLVRHGVAVEVVPGLTAGVAVPELVGIPVTHRGWTHGVTFVTGHTSASDEPDWSKLARLDTTLVIYMGLKRLAHIVERLLAGGTPPDTPSAVIAHGTLAAERHVVAPLFRLVDVSNAARLAAPAVIVIGKVVALARPAEQPLERARAAKFAS